MADSAILEQKVFHLESLLEAEKARVLQTETAFQAACQTYEEKQQSLQAEVGSLKTRIVELEVVSAQQLQERDSLAAKAKDVDFKQARIDELSNALSSLTQEKESLERLLELERHTSASQAGQLTQLTAARENLAAQVATLEAALQDVDTKRQMDLLRTQFDQTNRFHEQKIQYLEEELTSKTQALLDERRRSSGDMLSLRQQLSEAQAAAAQAEAKAKNTQFRATQLEEFLTQARNDAKAAEERAAGSESHYQAQVGRYTSLVEEAVAAREAADRETQQLRQQIEEVMKEIQEGERLAAASLARSEEGHAALEAALQEAKSQVVVLREACVQVLQTGDLPALAGILAEVHPLSPGNTTNRPGAPHTPLGPSDAAMARAAALVTAEAGGGRALFHTPGGAGGRGVAGTPAGGSMATPGGGSILGKSNTELYALYMNMSDAWRQERAEVRRLNAYLDTIASEISAKAAGIEQERQERAALESAHAVLQESVADLRAQLSRVQDHYEQAQAELHRSARQAGALQQTIQDQKQQLSSLTAEVSRLQGRPVPQQHTHSGAGADQLLEAGQIIDAHLVTFRNVQELIEQNRRLLSLSRTLSADLERKKHELKQELAADFMATEQGLKRELVERDQLVARLTGSAKHSADMIRQVQAELQAAKSQQAALLTNGGTPRSGAPSPRLLLGGPAGEGRAEGADNASVQQLQEDVAKLKAELETTRSHAANTVNEIRTQMSELREKYATAVGDAARDSRRAEDAERRIRDLQSHVASEQAATQNAITEKSRMAGLYQSSQQRLQEMQATLSDLQATVTAKSQRVLQLEVDVNASRAVAERSSAELSAIMAEKARLQVEAMTAEKLRESAESSLRSTTQELSSRIGSLTREMESREVQHTNQQRIFLASIEAAKSNVDDAKAETQSVRAAKEEVDKELAAVKQQVMELQVQLETSQATIASLTQQLGDANTRLNTRPGRTFSSALTGTALEAAEGALAGGGASGGVLSSAEMREVEARLREMEAELTSAREDAAGRQQHITTLQSTLDGLQAQYDAVTAQVQVLTEERDALLQQVEQERQEADSKVQSLVSQLEQSQASFQEQLSAAHTETGAARDEISRLSSEVTRLSDDLRNRMVRSADTDAEISRLQAAAKDYRQRYDQEIQQHAQDVKALQQSEAELERLHATVSSLHAQLAQSQAASSQAVGAIGQQREALAQELEQVKSKVSELQSANDTLLKEMQRMLKDTRAEGLGMTSTTYKELLDYLGRDKAMTSAQLLLLTEERTKLKQERDTATKQVADLRSQVADMQDLVVKGRADLQTRINALEADAQLRAIHLGNATAEATNAKKELEASKAQCQGLVQQVQQLQAAVSSLEGTVQEQRYRLKAAQDGEVMWSGKYQELVAQYGNVTEEQYRALQAEHEGLKAECAAVQAELSAVRSELEASSEGLQAQLAQLQEALQKEKDSKASEMAAAEEKFKGAALRGVKRVRTEMGKEKEALQEQLDTATKQLTTVKEQLEAKTAEAAGLAAQVNGQKIQGLIRREKESTARAAKLQQDLDALRNTHAAAITAHKNEVSTLLAKEKTLQEDITKLQQQVSQAQGRANNLAAHVNKLKQELAAARNAAANSAASGNPSNSAAAGNVAAGSAPPATAAAQKRKSVERNDGAAAAPAPGVAELQQQPPPAAAPAAPAAIHVGTSSSQVALPTPAAAQLQAAPVPDTSEPAAKRQAVSAPDTGRPTHIQQQQQVVAATSGQDVAVGDAAEQQQQAVHEDAHPISAAQQMEQPPAPVQTHQQPAAAAAPEVLELDDSDEEGEIAQQQQHDHQAAPEQAATPAHEYQDEEMEDAEQQQQDEVAGDSYVDDQGDGPDQDDNDDDDDDVQGVSAEHDHDGHKAQDDQHQQQQDDLEYQQDTLEETQPVDAGAVMEGVEQQPEEDMGNIPGTSPPLPGDDMNTEDMDAAAAVTTGGGDGDQDQDAAVDDDGQQSQHVQDEDAGGSETGGDDEEGVETVGVAGASEDVAATGDGGEDDEGNSADESGDKAEGDGDGNAGGSEAEEEEEEEDSSDSDDDPGGLRALALAAAGKAVTPPAPLEAGSPQLDPQPIGGPGASSIGGVRRRISHPGDGTVQAGAEGQAGEGAAATSITPRPSAGNAPPAAHRDSTAGAASRQHRAVVPPPAVAPGSPARTAGAAQQHVPRSQRQPVTFAPVPLPPAQASQPPVEAPQAPGAGAGAGAAPRRGAARRGGVVRGRGRVGRGGGAEAAK